MYPWTYVFAYPYHYSIGWEKDSGAITVALRRKEFSGDLPSLCDRRSVGCRTSGGGNPTYLPWRA